MEKKQDFKAAAYEQIKKLGGDSTESIKTVKTDIGDVDIRVHAEMDFAGAKKDGVNARERPYIYRANLHGTTVPALVSDKVNGKVYETAEAAFKGTKEIVEKYVEGLKAVDVM